MLIGGATITVALAVCDVFAVEIAVIVNVPVACGAVYSPVPEIVPYVELPPGTLFTSQVTPFVVAFCTEAVNCSVCPTPIVALVGEIEIVTVELLLFPLPQPAVATASATTSVTTVILICLQKEKPNAPLVACMRSAGIRWPPASSALTITA